MIEIEEARRLVLEGVSSLPSERLALRESLGRVLAEDVASGEDVPAFDNSAMDGFAVCAAETHGAGLESPLILSVVDESRAGHPATSSLEAGQAIAISTGGVIPTGADAVIPLEQTTARDGRVEILAEVKVGRYLRYAGTDIRGGDMVLQRGVQLGAAEFGVLASVGRSAVACTRRPYVRILTSGDELIEPDEASRPGAVRNSNAYSIPALAQQAGAEVTGISVVPDDPDATMTAIAQSLASDVTVICGGVSVGAHDHVKQALAVLGVEEVFWGIALKPGKPTWFGRHPGGLVFGLPGNPVSAMVTFMLFVRPVLLALSGARTEPRRTTARLDRDYEKSPGRAHALRCSLALREDGWHARPAEKQDSHVLTSMLDADALAIIPAASGSVRAGERVEIELLSHG
ncbi:MAG TPA: gephyrin-like molybdotransferase Glp [Solirubrobacteraceae bacterium]